MGERVQEATLVLMTLDELPALRAIWEHIPRAEVSECIAVDGGSSDGTKEFLAEHGIAPLVQTCPGWGEAARLGAEHATTSRVVFFSPDGNQDPDDIPLLLDKLDEGFDLAIASRFLAGAVHAEDGEYLKPRTWGCKAFTSFANRHFGHSTHITDATNGFRAITRMAMKRLNLDAPGFELAYQMTIRALEADLRIAEIPTFEGQRIAGKSKLRTLPAGMEHLRILVRAWRSRLR